MQWWIQGRGEGGAWPPLIFRPNVAQRAEKIFWEAGPPLSQDLDDRPPGLDPPLIEYVKLDAFDFGKVGILIQCT